MAYTLVVNDMSVNVETLVQSQPSTTNFLMTSWNVGFEHMTFWSWGTNINYFMQLSSIFYLSQSLLLESSCEICLHFLLIVFLMGFCSSQDFPFLHIRPCLLFHLVVGISITWKILVNIVNCWFLQLFSKVMAALHSHLSFLHSVFVYEWQCMHIDLFQIIFFIRDVVFVLIFSR